MPSPGLTNLQTGPTQHEEDTAHVSGDAGNLTLAVRNDAGGALAADQDYIPLTTDAAGRLRTVAAGAVGGTSMVDDSAFTVAADSVTPAGAIYRSVRDAVDDNDVGAVAMNQKRGMYVTLETPLSDSAMDEVNDAVRVNVVAGGGAGGTSMVDDAAFTPAVTNITPMGAFADEAAPDSVNEGDGGVVRMSLNRNLNVRIRDDAGNERGLNVDAAGAIAVTDGGGTLSVDDAGGALTVDGTVTVQDGGGSLTVDDGGGVLSVDDGGASLTVDNAVLSVVGGGAEATAQRVTIANDSTGLLSIDDNGASLTVDNPTISVVGGGVEATAQRVTIANDSTGVLTVDDGGGALSVDDNGGSLTVDNAVLSVVGGGVEATAQRVTIANDSTGLLSVDDNGGSLTVDGGVTADIRDGAGVALTSTLVGADQALDVNIVQTVGGAGGTSMVDDAVFTPATTNVTPIAGFADDTAPDSVDEGDAGAVRMSLNRNLYTAIRDAAGNERGVNVTAANELEVANAALSVVGGGAEATALRVTIANNSTGLVSVDDNAGSLTVDQATHDLLNANANIQVGDADVAVGNPVPVAGTAAESAAAAGNPVLIGGRYHASVAAADAVGDLEAVRLLVDSVGGVVKGHRADAFTANANYAAAQTDAVVEAAPAAGLALYVTDVLFTTEGANNIFLEAGAVTLVPTVYLAANGGWSAHFQTPIRWTTATAITITSSAAVNHSVLINGYTAP